MIAFETIYVMWKREVKRFLRSGVRILVAVTQPIFLLVSLGYGLGPMYSKAQYGNYLEFLTPGMIVMTIVFPAVLNGGQVIWDRRFGILQEAMVAPVPRSSIMLGRTLGGATIAVMQGGLLMLIATAGGFHPRSASAMVEAALVMSLIATVFSAIGMSISSKMKSMQSFQLCVSFFVAPLFFLSGALFPLTKGPKIMFWIAYGNPIRYSVDALRYALLGHATFNPALDLIGLLGMAVLFFSLGSYFFSTLEM